MLTELNKSRRKLESLKFKVNSKMLSNLASEKVIVHFLQFQIRLQ